MSKLNRQQEASQEFDIHAKLKSTNANWSYLFAAQPYEDGFNYQFRTNFVDEPEFAIYERIDNYFVLVDFFKSYEEACDDAKKLINEHPDIKNMIHKI